MPEPLRPAASKTFGRKNLFLVDTIAAYATGGGATVTEMTATSTLDITRMTFPSGTTLPSQSTERVRQDMRWGDTESFEFIGETQHSGGDMTYVLGVQGAAGSDGKKLFEAIPEGTTKFLVRRLAVKRDVAVVAGQFHTYWPIEIGPSLDDENNPGQSNAEVVARCSFAVTGKPVVAKAFTA